ncbi:hypothetical protein VTL71DRAFT_7654 [Oculimacula yallundae]|uniref:Uncharacterized protein n=1 Tax=Oculimacula yallundae TaxID=86028 RepID=A0ABR4BW90_9HELO
MNFKLDILFIGQSDRWCQSVQCDLTACIQMPEFVAKAPADCAPEGKVSKVFDNYVAGNKTPLSGDDTMIDERYVVQEIEADIAYRQDWYSILLKTRFGVLTSEPDRTVNFAHIHRDLFMRTDTKESDRGKTLNLPWTPLVTPMRIMV